METERIPGELKAIPHWVGWAYEWRKDKRTKPPRNPHDWGYASSTDAATWGTLDQAIWACAEHHGDGVGFALSVADPFVGIDLDHCLDAAGRPNAWAAGIVARFPGWYWETSPSGTGLHGIGRGALPGGKGKKNDRIECYDRGRYLTITGRVFDGHNRIGGDDASEALARLIEEEFRTTGPQRAARQPSAAVSAGDAEIIRRCERFRNGDTFRRLYAGSVAGYASASEADAALLSMLIFAGADDAQAARIVAGSGLRRDKHDTRRGELGYLVYSAGRIRALMSEFYEPPVPVSVTWADGTQERGRAVSVRVRIGGTK